MKGIQYLIKMILLFDNFINKKEAAILMKFEGKDIEISKHIKKTVIDIVKDKFNVNIKIDIEVFFPTPKHGHPWHCDGSLPKGKSNSDINDLNRPNYYEPWKNTTWVDNHCPLREFTATILLTDPSTYEGGELRIYDEKNDKILEFKENHYLSLLIMDSNRTNQHMVMPVISGERYTYKSWYNIY